MMPLTILPDPAQLHLLGLSADATTIMVSVATTAAETPCPVCGAPSGRVHSRYARRVMDLPWHGVTVQLNLRVRRFFCEHPACRRQIFTERLPGVVAPYGRRTERLDRWFTAVGFAAGGEEGRRLLHALGLATSAATLLRGIRRRVLPVHGTPRVLSIDDFALRRGHVYGSLLVDLERRQLVDLLPDRTAATVADWLHVHPGVQVVSRDRGGDYAEGTRQGAPEAVQVADRFHLLKNLGEATERILQRHTGLVQRVPVPHAAQPTAAPPRRDREAARVRTQAKTTARYEAIAAAASTGMSKRTIAHVLGLNRKTVQRYLAAGTVPARPRHQRQARILTPYEPYLLARWRQGDHNGVGLWREVVALGYPGQRANVARFVAHLRGLERDGATMPAPPPAPGLTPRRALGLLLGDAERASREQAAAVDMLRQLHPELDTAISLLRRFAGMVRAHSSDQLDQWLADATASGLPELATFVTKLQQDQAAVVAGLTLSWSQGQTEGQVNRLKLIKRSMYGRAKFDLLRQRVLYRHAS